MRKVYENEMRALEAGSIAMTDDGLEIGIGKNKLTINLFNFAKDTFWGVKYTSNGRRTFALGFYNFAFVNIVNIGNIEIHTYDIFGDED